MKTRCCKGGGVVAAGAAQNLPSINFLPKPQLSNEAAVAGNPRHPSASPQTITHGEE